MFGTKGLDQAQRTLEPARRAPSHQGVRFDISGNRTQFGFAAVFFAACAAVMVIELLDPRGVVINHLIELGPRGADVFFGVLLLSALGMSGTSGFCFVRSFIEERWLSLDATALRAPKSLTSSQQVQIGYASIQKIRLTKVRNQRSLVISGNGRAITLAEASFRTTSDFDRFLEELQARLDR